MSEPRLQYRELPHPDDPDRVYMLLISADGRPEELSEIEQYAVLAADGVARLKARVAELEAAHRDEIRHADKQEKRADELEKMLACGGRGCNTCDLYQDVDDAYGDALGRACTRDNGDVECLEDDEDPFRHWVRQKLKCERDGAMA